jgi:DNA-binding CsgD family transcriptional regulator
VRVSVLDAFSDPAVPELGYQLAGLQTRHEVLAAGAEMLSRIIPCDEIAWTAVETTGGRRPELVGWRNGSSYSDPAVADALGELNDHPMILSYMRADTWRNATPRRLSDIIDPLGLRRTRAYEVWFKPREIEHQISVMTAWVQPIYGRGWAMARPPRSTDFSDAECELLVRLQPLLRAVDRALPTDGEQATTVDGHRSHDDKRPELTPRELEVLAVVARGLTATACGHLLRISERTVRKHLENAYAKLDCHSAITATARARALGLLPG